MRTLLPMLLVLLAGGCAAGAGSAREPAVAIDSDGSGAEVAAPEGASAEAGDPVEGAATPAQLGTIPRARLLTRLDGGLGHFLRTVRVDAVLQRGSFVGFRIVAFRDAEGLYDGVDLLPGDVVTRVNGSPIERPEQALAVWNGLRVTSELCVEYVRNGERREIRYPIVE